jgi:hypothetical protein
VAGDRERSTATGACGATLADGGVRLWDELQRSHPHLREEESGAGVLVCVVLERGSERKLAVAPRTHSAAQCVHTPANPICRAQLLILIENPLLMEPNHHTVLLKLMRVISSQPTASQASLQRLFQTYTRDQMLHAVGLSQQFLTIHLYDCHQIDSAVEAATHLLSLLHAANKLVRTDPLSTGVTVAGLHAAFMQLRAQLGGGNHPRASVLDSLSLSRHRVNSEERSAGGQQSDAHTSAPGRSVARRGVLAGWACRAHAPPAAVRQLHLRTMHLLWAGEASGIHGVL